MRVNFRCRADVEHPNLHDFDVRVHVDENFNPVTNGEGGGRGKRKVSASIFIDVVSSLRKNIALFIG